MGDLAQDLLFPRLRLGSWRHLGPRRQVVGAVADPCRQTKAPPERSGAGTIVEESGLASQPKAYADPEAASMPSNGPAKGSFHARAAFHAAASPPKGLRKPGASREIMLRSTA